jgi:cyclophilin family peptidyl-prolyl cis-trans isomerase
MIPNENGSQFYIALAPAPIHDGRYVVFGNLVSGLEVLRELERLGSWKGVVQANIRVSRCGELRLPKDVALPDASPSDDGKATATTTAKA